MSRIQKTFKNVSYSVTLSMIVMLAKFLARYVFIRYLSYEYLGSAGLFSNILTLLSFAELGIGNAIVFSLYKPLAQNDHEKIKTLVNLYKKSYLIIAVIVGVAGLCAIPLLPILTNHSTLDNLVLIYCMYLFDTMVSYVTADKQSLLIADQKRFVLSSYQSFFNILQQVVQIIVIVVYSDFILFLSIQILCKILQNIWISKYVLKNYPYLTEKNIAKLDDEEKKVISKNIKAAFLHNTGDILVDNTDNLIMSSFLGLTTVGIYGTHMMFINAAVLIKFQMFNSIQASIGNLNAEVEDLDYKYTILKRLDMMYFLIFSAVSLGFFFLFRPLMVIYNNNIVFGYSVLAVMIINFYIASIRSNINQFKYSCGLFYKDRFKPILEVLANFILSILLIQKWGLFGILFATTMVRLLITCPIEQYIVFKYYFNKSFIKYYVMFLIKILFVLFLGTVLYVIELNFLMGVNIIVKFVIACALLLILLIIFCFIFKNNDSVIYFKNMMKIILNKIIGKAKASK
ncbi:MAG: hypothetical protein MR210_03160 [Erysipelotrichaceae bacterium]|nr:hypothetical protein [Erysipelotrichaceae bacterium]